MDEYIATSVEFVCVMRNNTNADTLYSLQKYALTWPHSYHTLHIAAYFAIRRSEVVLTSNLVEGCNVLLNLFSGR